MEKKTTEELVKSIVDWHKKDIQKKVGNKKRHKQ